MIEGKRLRNMSIGQVKRNAGAGSYRTLKQMVSDRE